MELLEVGLIVNTHGIKGELKVMHYCDNAEVFLNIEKFYLDDKTVFKVKTKRTHKKAVLITVEGILDINEAEKYKNRMLFADREDIGVDEDAIFQTDIIGIVVFDEFLGKEIGKIVNILNLPQGDVFVIKGEKKEHLVPDVDAFIKEIDIENGTMTICTIEGMIDV